MDEMFCSVVLFLLTLLLVIALKYFSRGSRRKLPPGPAPYPVIGNILELGAKPHKSLARLAKIHGPIMSLRLGQVTTIVFSSADMAKEALQVHDSSLCDRMIPDAAIPNDQHKYALTWLPVSTPWRNLRKICNSHIFSPHSLDANQGLRGEKIQQLLAHVQENCNAKTAIDVGQAAFNTSLNLLSCTIFSSDLLADLSSESAREHKEIVWGIMEEAGKPNISDFFPVLKRFDIQGIRRRFAVYSTKVYDLADRLIDQRLKQRQEISYTQSKDMLDTLLSIVEDKSVEIDRHYIKHLILVLIVAGTDTTSSTLEWALAELLRNPDELKRTRSELEETIGRGNPVDESDILRLPYLQAVIKETLRLHPATPLLVPHKAIEDVEIAGFMVPRGAQVLVNVWAIARDDTLWDNPLSFMPQRFLRSDLDVKGRHFELIPFGAGRRVCPALPLAMRMLHVMLGSLVNCFDWELEDGVSTECMDMEDEFGLTLKKAQPLRVVPIAL